MVSTALPTDLPELVDWQLAARVGRRVAGGSELPARAAWSRQFTELSTIADRAVAEFTGLGGELPPPVAEPLDRGEWVEANLATLRRILRPLAEKVAERKAWKASGPVPTAMRTSTRAIAGAQAGTLLGYVGQRVLGQYDLPLPGPDQGASPNGDGPLSAPVRAHGEGTVWYVVPNIVATERRHRFRPADFRLWIALHETAHRRQFRGVPWLPGHIQGLLDEYLGSVEVDDEAIRRLTDRLQGLARRMIAGEKIELLDLLVTPEQKTIVDRIQSTMTVLEGHGEFVMDQLGDRLVPGHQHMHDTLRARRNAQGAAERLIQQLLGFRQKLDQYAMGERFVRRLFERGGMDAVNQVFAEPAALPTMDEVRDPERYLARSGRRRGGDDLGTATSPVPASGAVTRAPAELRLVADRAAKALAAAGVPAAGDGVAVAVSGGADSLALLHALRALAGPRGWRLAVVTVDHGLRPGSAADAAFVADHAKALGLPARVRTLAPADLEPAPPGRPRGRGPGGQVRRPVAGRRRARLPLAGHRPHPRRPGRDGAAAAAAGGRPGRPGRHGRPRRPPAPAPARRPPGRDPGLLRRHRPGMARGPDQRRRRPPAQPGPPTAAPPAGGAAPGGDPGPGPHRRPGRRRARLARPAGRRRPGRHPGGGCGQPGAPRPAVGYPPGWGPDNSGCGSPRRLDAEALAALPVALARRVVRAAARQAGGPVPDAAATDRILGLPAD